MSDTVSAHDEVPAVKCTALAVIDKRKKELMVIPKSPSPDHVFHYICASAESFVLHEIALHVPEALHLAYRLGEGAAGGIGLAASKHLYKKVGEGLVDKVLETIQQHLPTKTVEPAPTLYGPDGRATTTTKKK